MEIFKADEYGHRASIKNSDLGYGWIHYSFIRTTRPKNILCIGSRYGYIPAILAQACKDNGKGHVDFVDAGYGKGDKDHWTGEGYWKTKYGQNVFNAFALGKFISLYITTTQDFAKTTKKIYDYIYIDGDHSYKGVSFDYNKFWPKLAKNGFMAFHDIDVKGIKSEGLYGVQKLWKQIAVKNYLVFPFLGSGLGIIQKN
jgi:predicted O-methyltransferase YrrM